MEKMKEKISSMVGKVEESVANCFDCIITPLKAAFKYLKRVLSIAATYLDLTTDTILLVAVMTIVISTAESFTNFTFQVVFILLLSIVVPIFISAIMIAYTRPLVILGAKRWKRLSTDESRIAILKARIAIIFFFPLVPALIVHSRENAKEQKRSLKGKDWQKTKIVKNSVLEASDELTAYINEARLALLTFKRNELSLELIAQISIHLMMVLLSKTNYPLESGLQGIFQSSNTDTTTSSSITEGAFHSILESLREKFQTENAAVIFLILSIAWSFRSCAMTAVRIKNEEKCFLPFFPAQLLLLMRYALVFFVRISCIVCYFAPFLGLLDIVIHYQAETKPLDYNIFKYINETSDQKFHYWIPEKDEFKSIPVSQLFRSTYPENSNKKAEPPSTTVYTVISLGEAFGIFWAFYLVYGLFLTLLKYCISKDFQKGSHGKRIQHIVELLNIPEAFRDWDTDHTLDVDGHIARWKKVLIEMITMAIMQTISNIILLIPFLVTGTSFDFKNYFNHLDKYLN